MKNRICLLLIILVHAATAQGQYNWKVTSYSSKGYSHLYHNRDTVRLWTRSDTVFQAPFPERGGTLQRTNSYTREFVFTENGLYRSTTLDGVQYSLIENGQVPVPLYYDSTNFPRDYLPFQTHAKIRTDTGDTNLRYISLAEVYNIVLSINRTPDAAKTDLVDIFQKRVNSLVASADSTQSDLSIRMTKDTIITLLDEKILRDTLQVKRMLDALSKRAKKIESYTELRRTDSNGRNKRWLVDSLHEQFPMTKMQLREKFMEQLTRVRPGSAIFTAGVHYTPSFANHSVLIGTTRFNDNKALDSRNERESNRYGHELGVQLGLTFRSKHTLFVGGLHAMQGFRSRGQGIDWSSGMPVAGTDKNYRFEYNGLGLGYGFSSYRRLINLEAELGVYHLWLSRFDDGRTTLYKRDDIRGLDLKTEAWTGKLGLGLNIRPTYGMSFRLMPSLLYNFTAADAGTLRTKFFNLGLTLGCQFRLVRKSYGVER